MSKSRKRFIFIILFFSFLQALVILRYERLLKETRKEMHFEPVAGGASSGKNYTAAEIVTLIRNSKEYLRDSVTIFDNGSIKSSNDKFQGTIEAVRNSKDNMDMVKANMSANKLPVQYNIYILAAMFYRQQYSSEFPPEKQ